MGKQTKTSFKSTKHISTSRPLDLFHTDLFGSGGKMYTPVIVDDFTRFIWVMFLATIYEGLKSSKICIETQTEKSFMVSKIRMIMVVNLSGHFKKFCDENGIACEFLASRTVQ